MRDLLTTNTLFPISSSRNCPTDCIHVQIQRIPKGLARLQFEWIIPRHYGRPLKLCIPRARPNFEILKSAAAFIGFTGSARNNGRQTHNGTKSARKLETAIDLLMFVWIAPYRSEVMAKVIYGIDFQKLAVVNKYTTRTVT